jgi:N-acetylglucosamine-6-phosphate deacetylase
MTVLRAARIVTGDGGISAGPAWVVVAGGLIVASGTGDPPRDSGPVVDHRDLLLAPAFVDLQVNGAGTTDFATASVDELVDTVGELARGGCAGCLPTLVSAPTDSYVPALERLARAQRRAPGILGVHLEGPFLGGAPGAHPVALLRPVDLDWLLDVCDRFAGLVRVVTLAPEADPGFDATRALAARGIVVSLGHSTATYEDAKDAADAGARMVTHVFNGMGPLHHRAPGLPGAALDDRRLVPGFIADLVHVHRAVLRLVLAVRPDAVLVTDRVAGAPGTRGDAVRRPDGTLAGSVVTMERSVRNLVLCGIPPGAAVRAATANPARLLGLADRGRVAPGCRAELVWLDPGDLSLRARWPDGDPPGS